MLEEETWSTLAASRGRDELVSEPCHEHRSLKTQELLSSLSDSSVCVADLVTRFGHGPAVTGLLDQTCASPSLQGGRGERRLVGGTLLQISRLSSLPGFRGWLCCNDRYFVDAPRAISEHLVCRLL